MLLRQDELKTLQEDIDSGKANIYGNTMDFWDAFNRQAAGEKEHISPHRDEERVEDHSDMDFEEGSPEIHKLVKSAPDV